KELEHVFLNVLVGMTPHTDVLKSSRALLDFIHLVQYLSHINYTLQALQTVLNTFHRFKDIFVCLRCCKHFNISKLHVLGHYVDSI
ncbi:hypothetical protein J3R82DRAFT_2929, partial [Butyriboletus roseoflavus]